MLQSRYTYALLIVGGGLFLAGLTVLSGTVATGVTALGLGVAIVAAFVIDLTRGDVAKEDGIDRERVLYSGMATAGILLLLVVPEIDGVPTVAQWGARAAGTVAILAGGYGARRHGRQTELDERDLRIRYRAAYNAFLVVSGLVFVGTVAAVSIPSSSPDGDPVTAAVALTGAGLIAAGGLTFAFSEGWYRTRM